MDVVVGENASRRGGVLMERAIRPVCVECGAELLLTASGWLCPNGHGKVRPMTPLESDTFAGLDIYTGPDNPCPECDGTGEVECYYCDGTGYETCGHCGGETECCECDGEGTITCDVCEGKKVVTSSVELSAKHCRVL